MASGNDLIKYVTVELVNYIETPRDERKQNKASAKALREHWLTRWFGLGPISVMLWWRSRKN
ncbi:MAG: YqzE family protein [Candidatus Pristimantibacillus sp.]